MLAFLKNVYYALFFPNEQQDMENWAFGDGWKDKTMIQRMDSWNEIHGTLHTFSPNDKLHEAMQIIENFWIEYKKNKNEK
jgi:hypothetical protein